MSQKRFNNLAILNTYKTIVDKLPLRWYPVINDKFFSFLKVHFFGAKFIAEFENQSKISRKAVVNILLAFFVNKVQF